MDEREELAKDMLEQVWFSDNKLFWFIVTGWVKTMSLYLLYYGKKI